MSFTYIEFIYLELYKILVTYLTPFSTFHKLQVSNQFLPEDIIIYPLTEDIIIYPLTLEKFPDNDRYYIFFNFRKISMTMIKLCFLLPKTISPVHHILSSSVPALKLQYK